MRLLFFLFLSVAHLAAAQQPIYYGKIPHDTTTMGELITQWDSDMLDGSTWTKSRLDSVRNQTALSYYEEQLRQKKSCEQMDKAIDMIGKFTKSDVAFDLLKSVITQTGNFSPPKELRCNEYGYSQIKYNALKAIAQNKNASVIPFIMSLKNDADAHLRETVVESLWWSDPVEGLSALEELSHDTMAYIREKARSYLQEMHEDYQPCIDTGIQMHIVLNKDTVELGESPIMNFSLQNCTGKQTFLYHCNGEFIPQSSGAFVLTITTDKAVKDKNVDDPYLQNGMIYFSPFFPNTTQNASLLLSKYANLDELGRYEVSVTKKITLSTERSIFVAFEEKAVETIELREIVHFVVVPKQ